VSAAAGAPRVVVYGDYPPYPTPAATATLATVRSLLNDGREIEVVSPSPSAAHHHADIGKPNGAAKLARLVGGAELVARFPPGILSQARRPGPVSARAALGLAVRRARSATIYLSPLKSAPAARWVKVILDPATQVVVASRDDADRLRAAGLGGANLSVAEDSWWLPPAAPAGGEAATVTRAWAVPTGASREAIEAEVRRRAVAHREHESANPVSASWPLHMLHPLSPAPPGASNALFRLVKRYVHRLVAWEVVPIVEQVNHLQRATIESLDRHATAVAEAQRPSAETSS
jgi:hypothetical protein